MNIHDANTKDRKRNSPILFFCLKVHAHSKNMQYMIPSNVVYQKINGQGHDCFFDLPTRKNFSNIFFVINSQKYTGSNFH